MNRFIVQHGAEIIGAADLEQARRAAVRIVGDSASTASVVADELLQARGLPSTGGAIGPLPDGSFVTMRPIESKVIA